jgi:hypothetical protein
VDRSVRHWFVKLLLEEFCLLAIWKPLMESTKGGLGHDAWPKSPGLRALRMLSKDFVSARALMLAKLVLNDGCGNWKRNVDNSL